MLWTQYFMGMSWIWVQDAVLPHKQCDFEVCQLLLGYCLCLWSAVKTVNFETSQAWCPWECEALLCVLSVFICVTVYIWKSALVLSGKKQKLKFIPDLFWAILLGLCGESPLFHIASLSTISLMPSVSYQHICYERTAFAATRVQQPVFGDLGPSFYICI